MKPIAVLCVTGSRVSPLHSCRSRQSSSSNSCATELQGVKDQTGLMLKSVYDADNDGEVDMHGETF